MAATVLKKAEFKNIEVGQWYWLEGFTGANCEGLVQSPVKVMTKGDQMITVKIYQDRWAVLGTGSRGDVVKLEFQENGFHHMLFVPNQEQFAEYIKRELERVNSLRQKLEVYEAELKSVQSVLT